jgi:hypothetical protein
MTSKSESVSFEDIFDESTVKALESAETNEEYVTILRKQISKFIGQKVVEATKAAFYADREAARIALQESFDSTWQALEHAAQADGNWTRRPE